MAKPTASRGTASKARFLALAWSSLNQSAMVSRAERKAVSPEVMGQAMTPTMASTPPTGPKSPVQISKTTPPWPWALIAA